MPPRRVPDGREVDLDCPECKKVTHWVECELKDEYDSIFGRVGAARNRRMVCQGCSAEVEIDTLPAPTPPNKRSTEWDREALLAAIKAKMAGKAKP